MLHVRGDDERILVPRVVDVLRGRQHLPVPGLCRQLVVRVRQHPPFVHDVHHVRLAA